MDSAFPEHARVSKLLTDLAPESMVAINPTVLHESYHTLVYHQKWTKEEAKYRLSLLMRHPYVPFRNQTRSTSLLALNLANKYRLGGRDSLILASFLANHAPRVYTHDSELLTMKRIEWRGLRTNIVDPISR